MFKCPQNGIFGSAESSQTFLVEEFSLQQPRITLRSVCFALKTDRGFKAGSWT